MYWTTSNVLNNLHCTESMLYGVNAVANWKRVERVEMGRDGWEVRRGSEARWGWARDSEGRVWSSSFFYQLWNIYIKFASSGNEFNDFSAWTPLMGRDGWEVRRGSEARWGWARDSEGRVWSSSFFYQLWNIYIKFASSGNEFNDFSAWTPLSHFAVQRWWAGICTRRKIKVFSTPMVKSDCH